MFDVSEVNLFKEIHHAERTRDKRLSIFKTQRAGYMSSFFKSESGEQSDSRMDYNPENIAFGIVRQVVPQLVMHNPRINLASRVYGIDRQLERPIPLLSGVTRVGDATLVVTTEPAAIIGRSDRVVDLRVELLEQPCLEFSIFGKRNAVGIILCMKFCFRFVAVPDLKVG